MNESFAYLCVCVCVCVCACVHACVFFLFFSHPFECFYSMTCRIIYAYFYNGNNSLGGWGGFRFVLFVCLIPPFFIF